MIVIYLSNRISFSSIFIKSNPFLRAKNFETAHDPKPFNMIIVHKINAKNIVDSLFPTPKLIPHPIRRVTRAMKGFEGFMNY